MGDTGMTDEWTTAMTELCAAYNIPATAERLAAYRKSLGKLHIASWHKLVEHCLGPKGPEKMPTVPQLWRIHRELRAAFAPIKAREQDEEFTKWEIHANKVLFQLAYQDLRRGANTKPIAEYPPMPEGGYGVPLVLPKPTDSSRLDACLRTKREVCQMANDAEARGETWTIDDFNDVLYAALEKILGSDKKREAA